MSRLDEIKKAAEWQKDAFLVSTRKQAEQTLWLISEIERLQHDVDLMESWR